MAINRQADSLFAQNAPGADIPRFSVIGVETERALSKEIRESLNMEDFSGTKLSLLLEMPKAAVLQIDDNATSITKAADDTGKDLNTSGSLGRSALQLVRISPDGSRALLVWASPQLPAQGATKVMLNGNVKIVTGKEAAVRRYERVQLAKGEKIDLAGVPGVVDTATEDQGRLRVRLNFAQELHTIQTIKFFSTDGAEIENRISGRGTVRTSSGTSFWRVVDLERVVPQVTIEVKYWTKVEPVVVPIQLEARLGY